MVQKQRVIILGSNGVGKSNLLESIEFLSQLKSSRALNDKDLINNESEYSKIYAQINSCEEININLFRKGQKKIFVNDNLIKKQSDIKKYVRSVCFSANDINIVKGEPNLRRIWLDKVVAQLEPVYLELLARFNKLLKQRRHFWRSNFIKNYSSKELIDSFDSQMALIGARIMRRRKRALKKLKPYIESWHKYLSKSKEEIDFNYICALSEWNEEEDEKVIIENLQEKLFKQRYLEEITGKCSIGPHRDDIEFLINGFSVRKFGSSGQQRTLILAFKMAELDLLKQVMSINPILILDDVLAELDIFRQNLLLESVGKNSQCLISSTHLEKFNTSFVENSQIIYL